MTRDGDFKKIVRSRMAATDETYTAARAALLAERERHRAEDEAYDDRTVRVFFDGPRLRTIPARRRARVVVLLELLKRFDVDGDYTEREVNELLAEAHEDVAWLRRELVDYRYLQREAGRYWVNTDRLVRDARESQEVPVFEEERVPRLP